MRGALHFCVVGLRGRGANPTLFLEGRKGNLRENGQVHESGLRMGSIRRLP
jgi:hypothetical protein